MVWIIWYERSDCTEDRRTVRSAVADGEIRFKGTVDAHGMTVPLTVWTRKLLNVAAVAAIVIPVTPITFNSLRKRREFRAALIPLEKNLFRSDKRVASNVHPRPIFAFSMAETGVCGNCEIVAVLCASVLGLTALVHHVCCWFK